MTLPVKHANNLKYPVARRIDSSISESISRFIIFKMTESIYDQIKYVFNELDIITSDKLKKNEKNNI